MLKKETVFSFVLFSENLLKHGYSFLKYLREFTSETDAEFSFWEYVDNELNFFNKCRANKIFYLSYADIGKFCFYKKFISSYW